MADLDLYRARRDPARTPEPFGEGLPSRGLRPDAPRLFVVQQHAARRMHWDVRLEIEGALANWAVPRGPSAEPGERRLAVRTEDHPLPYADFEGVIPAGSYGAGPVIVWDRGIWRPAGGASPAASLARGKLDVVFEGFKLRGRFTLVRTGRHAASEKPEGAQWLLLAKRAVGAGEEALTRRLPASVLSGLTVEERAADVMRDDEVAQLARRAGAKPARTAPEGLRPMLAAAGEGPFRRSGWLFELKLDGVRALAHRTADGRTRLRVRTGADRTALYPELASALARIPLAGFVIDGEIVAFDAEGRPSFERLQRRFTRQDADALARAPIEVPVAFVAFDLLHGAGYDWRDVPLLRRKEALARFVPRLGVVSFADHVEGDGVALYEAARTRGLEGVVAKRADAPYRAGRRSRHWLKLKVPRTATLAIVGSLPGKGSRGRLGSLLLAGRREGALAYVGAAGSGLGEAQLRRLDREIEAQRRKAPAFVGGPERWPRGTRFCDPTLACEVRFTEVTAAGLLRQPVFLRLREDVEPAACAAPSASAVAEAAQARAGSPAPEAGFAPTRLDALLWPASGITKGDLLAYYEAVWPWLEPYLKDRPLVPTRYPDGIEGRRFTPHGAPELAPSRVPRASIDGTSCFVVNDLSALLGVVNGGAIPLHVWSARLGSLGRPDWLVLDFDPEDAPFAAVAQVARALHHLLDDLGAAHFVKSSGQDGLHVLVPLGGSLDHAQARTLAEALARSVCAELPDLATLARPRAARRGRVYVNALQNGRGKLLVAPLSARPRPGAPVSMPLAWRRITKRLDPARFTIRSAPAELRRHGDPMRPVLDLAIDVDAVLDALARRARAAR